MDSVVLTDAQIKLMVDTWNANPEQPPKVSELAKVVFGKECELRSPEMKALKVALANRKMRTGNTVELSEAHKQYITNNKSTMNAKEMARIIFANPNLTNLNAETRAVNEYIKTLGTSEVYDQDTLENTPSEDYRPPTTLDQAIKRVNTYISSGINRDKLTAQQKKNMEVLIGYLQTYRFVAQMNSYESNDDRKLCEDAFVRYTYDKPDLSQEEIDQYIELANQIVQGYKIQRRSERLQAELEEISTNEDPENKKYSMGLVEAIGKASTEYHQCIARQEKLITNLTQKRSRRLEHLVNDSGSVLGWIQAWKTEEGRQELLKHAQREQAEIAKEVDRLSSLPELKARIFGQTKNGILYG